MGLLRGIKHGTESYHVLFKRLCRLVYKYIRVRIVQHFGLMVWWVWTIHKGKLFEVFCKLELQPCSSKVTHDYVHSYAGLHCVVIKGYSKSAGYQPGVRFEDNRFRNSWNAVYVAGAWRFVQCNWGARHLVNAKEVPKTGSKGGKSDSLRFGSLLDY